MTGCGLKKPEISDSRFEFHDSNLQIKSRFLTEGTNLNLEFEIV